MKAKIAGIMGGMEIAQAPSMIETPDAIRGIYDAAAACADAQYRMYRTLGSQETVNAAVTRQLAAIGIIAWNVGIVAEGGHVVMLLSSCDGRLKTWNRRYAAEGWGKADPVTAYGRSTGGIIAMDAIPGIDAPAVAAIATARRQAGLTNGLVMPWGNGGYASAFDFSAAALDDPGNPQRMAAVTLLRWLAIAGDFSGAARFNRGGLTCTPVEVAVLRARLAGKTYEVMAADGEIGSVSAGAQTIQRLKKRLIAAGLMAADAPLSAVPEIAWRYGLFQDE